MEKSRIAAAFLALFFGGFGVHKFYLRDYGGGIFYIMIMLFTLRWSVPVTAILGVIDAVRLFSMDDEAFDRKYNKGELKTRHIERRPYNRKSNSSRENNRKQRERYRYERASSKKRENPFKRSGIKKYEEYDLESAEDDLKHALTINPEDPEIHFYLAIVYSLMEKPEAGFISLEKAVELGFKDTKRIMEVEDLAFLRIQKEFEIFKLNGYKRTNSPKALPQEDLLQDDVLLSQLNKLKDMRTRGLLSEKEFVQEKEKLFRK